MAANQLVFALLILSVSAVCSQFLAPPPQQQQQQSMPNGQPPVPPFLRGAPAEKVHEFRQLFQNASTKTDAEIDAMVENWVRAQTPQIQISFAVFKRTMEKQRAATNAAHLAALRGFSPEARAADQKLLTIGRDERLSATEKAKQMAAVVAALPTPVRAEIEKAMRG